MHGIIRAGVPLMEAARARASELADDPVADGLAEYLDEHIPEEEEHDGWLLEDLELLGVAGGSVLERPPSSTVAALVGAQYYWIFHYHPVALLGYIAVLEGYPPDPAEVDRLSRRMALPTGAFRTLAAHADSPAPPRRADGRDRRASPQRGAGAALGVSAIYTVHMTARALDEVSDRSGASAR